MKKNKLKSVRINFFEVTYERERERESVNEGNERGRPPRSIARCAKLYFLVLLLTNKEMLKGVLKKKTNFKHISHGRDDG